MLDNSSNTSDNSTNDDNDGYYEVINLENVEPLNKKDCKHQFEKDSEIIGDRQAWICVHCKRGTFLAKGQTIINS